MTGKQAVMRENDGQDVFRAFADENDRDKIEGLLAAGLVKTGTLILMERDIDSFTGFENASGNEPGTVAFDRLGGDASGRSENSAEVEFYDVDKYGLSEYIEANRSGFTGGTGGEVPGGQASGAGTAGGATSESTIREELSYKNSAIYVLRVDGKIVSSVTVWDHDDETVCTENIFTIPGYRNRHFATHVLKTALADAMSRGMVKARLTVYAGNDIAVSMYQKLGYVRTKSIIEFGTDPVS